MSPGELYHFASIDTSALALDQQAAFARAFTVTPGTPANAKLNAAVAQALQSLHPRLQRRPRPYPDNTTHTVKLVPQNLCLNQITHHRSPSLRPHRVLAALLLLAPFAAPLASHAQYLAAASVTFRHADPYSRRWLLGRPAPALQPGRFLSNDSLANAAQHLLDTGLFSDATIDYTGTGMRRGIVVDLKPIPLDKLLPASFENFVWFTPDELTAGIHAHVPLYRGVASDAGSLPDDIQAALQQMLAAKGITATISHTIAEPTNLQPRRVLNFSIDQPFVRLGTLHLSMLAPSGAAATLSPGLQQAANAATRHPFNEGLTGITLSSILLDPFRRAGYVQASLDNIEMRTVAPAPAPADANASSSSLYTARIVTGDPYKISTLTWNPTPLYSAADFERDNKLHPRRSRQ